MDFSSILKFTKEKTFVTDVIFYIAISFLISSILCYLIFLVKISSQKYTIKTLEESMLTIGTEEQKEKEAQIFKYQKKINDYAKFLKDHKSALNVFSFLEEQTMPEVWFSRISLSEKEYSVILTGEANNMDVLSKQVMNFEKSEFVKRITILNSSVADSGKIKFSLTLSLKENLFVPLPQIIIW